MKKLLLVLLSLLALTYVSAETVVLVSDNSADYATALAIAEALNATIVTTEWGIYNESLITKIENLTPDNVIIVGGPLAVVENYTKALEDYGINVERVGGKDRYQTNAIALNQFKLMLQKRFKNMSACICYGYDDIALNESINLVANGSVPILTNGLNLSVNPKELNISKAIVIENPVCPCNMTKIKIMLQNKFKIKVMEKFIPKERIRLMLMNKIKMFEHKLVRLKISGNVTKLEEELNEVKQLIEQNKLEEAFRIMVKLDNEFRVMVKMEHMGRVKTMMKIEKGKNKINITNKMENVTVGKKLGEKPEVKKGYMK
ncbi:putative cell wall binding repeat 2-containing protein [Methanocaldococcus infernus ME]|uniref:Cell wall binding repeat 2-containing protein n=1 Tax=Methanocaldococcus infernus (strain DSM 11812 / JCM 15783 / ME) TaxID=573063 RepID=D5VSZ0_METIM|nr:cell wall-binding repeat 2-containing protein [Methanocaldococcus infernus]ADG13693.1 putative cell wall binding repeat 2-containing protein [Methanocaldococcus infernus ME]